MERHPCAWTSRWLLRARSWLGHLLLWIWVMMHAWCCRSHTDASATSTAKLTPATLDAGVPAEVSICKEGQASNQSCAKDTANDEKRTQDVMFACTAGQNFLKVVVGLVLMRRTDRFSKIIASRTPISTRQKQGKILSSNQSISLDFGLRKSSSQDNTGGR